MQASVRNQVAERSWFRKVPSAAATSGLGVAMIVFSVFAVLGVGFWIAWTRALPKALLLLIPLLPIIITLAVIRAKLKRGQRTAEGRATCDQVEGFRNYLATAEADQLKFEEGEDIFSKYLPWAIIFELADRWAKIWGVLVAMGRLPNETPYCYIGNYQNDGLQHRVPYHQPHIGSDTGPLNFRCRWHRLWRGQLLRRRRLLRWWRRRRRQQRLVSS